MLRVVLKDYLLVLFEINISFSRPFIHPSLYEQIRVPVRPVLSYADNH